MGLGAVWLQAFWAPLLSVIIVALWYGALAITVGALDMAVRPASVDERYAKGVEGIISWLRFYWHPFWNFSGNQLLDVSLWASWITALMSSIWLWVTLLATPVVRFVGSEGAQGFLNVREHPVRVLGLVAVTYLAAMMTLAWFLSPFLRGST